MERLQPGTFNFVVSSEKGYQRGITNRSSILAMIEDERTEKVRIMRNGKEVKTYTRMKWAAKWAKYAAPGSCEYVFYPKKENSNA